MADRQTALRVKAALSEDLGLAAAPITVDVANGIVTLSGFTATAAERDRAVAAVRRVEAVREVNDHIQVRP